MGGTHSAVILVGGAIIPSKGDITINLTVQGDVNGIDDLSALAVQAVTEARAAGASV